MESDELPFELRTALKMDEIARSVMPDNWVGHGRLTILESEDLSINQKQKGVKAVERLSEKKPDKNGETLAEAVIPHIQEKYN